MDQKELDRHMYFMGITEAISEKSPCLRRKVGCVLLDKYNHIIGTGYNGPARGVMHCKVCHRKNSGKDLYDCQAIHAEMNALVQCKNTNDIVAVYVLTRPCMICTRLLANTSCELIIYQQQYADDLPDFLRFWEGRLHRKSIYLQSV